MLTEAAMVRRAATRQTESARLPFSLSQPPGCGLVAAARRWRLPIRRMRRRFRPYCPATIAQAQASLACIQRCARGSGSAAAQRPPQVQVRTQAVGWTRGLSISSSGGCRLSPLTRRCTRACRPRSALRPQCVVSASSARPVVRSAGDERTAAPVPLVGARSARRPRARRWPVCHAPLAALCACACAGCCGQHWQWQQRHRCSGHSRGCCCTHRIRCCERRTSGMWRIATACWQQCTWHGAHTKGGGRMA